MLIYSRYWKSRNGQSWWYYLKDLLSSLWYVTKYSWQRARRGWATPDTWMVSHWFASTVPPMLRDLAKDYEDPDAIIGIQEEYYHHPERWAGVLRQIASDIEAPMVHERLWFEGDDSWYKLDSTGDEQARMLEDCLADEVAAHNRQKAGLAAFMEYFYEIGD